MSGGSDVLHAVLSILTFVGFAGAIALYNTYQTAQWKRAELANAYLKDFCSDPEVAFACRALEWTGGKLIVPECLRPLAGGKDVIEHDPRILAEAMTPQVDYDAMRGEFRLQLYRTAFDSLLTKLSIVASALGSNLFQPDDIEEVGYWVVRIKQIGFAEGFIRDYGYARSTALLRSKFHHQFRHFADTALNRGTAHAAKAA